MLPSHRIHAEQIKKVAQNMKALYNIRHAEPGIQKNSGWAGTRVNRTKPASTTVTQLYASQTRNGNVPAFNNGNADIISADPVPALRCMRCNDHFLVTDFLYTKKSGLCISCWEVKVL
jgi:hypothetical protein